MSIRFCFVVFFYIEVVVCLSIFLLSFDACLFYILCVVVFFIILFVKLYVSLSFFFCLMHFSCVFIFSIGIFGIFVIYVHC